MNVFLIAVPSTALAVFAQQSTGTGGSFDLVQALGSIGVGGVLAVPFVVVWRLSMKRVHDLEAEVKSFNDQRLHDVLGMVTRERELSNSMAPLLQQAAEALRETPVVFDRAIEKAAGTATRNESDLRVRQIELAMDTLVQRLGDKP